MCICFRRHLCVVINQDHLLVAYSHCDFRKEIIAEVVINIHKYTDRHIDY